MGNGLTEHEYDHVLIGSYNDKIQPNEEEVAAWAYIPMDVIEQDMENNPEKYTPWFRIVFSRIRTYLYEQKAA